MKRNKIYEGNCIEVLKEWPDECVDMVMTSPPYWALRDYGTADWEGGDEDCDHVIEKELKENAGDWKRPSRKENAKVGAVMECVVCGEQFKGKIGNKFCSTDCLNTLSNEERSNAVPKILEKCKKCGAIRKDDQLGLEDTPEEFINNLCDVFDEVKRVLKPAGTCWVNLGDTYGGNISSNWNTSDKKPFSGSSKKMEALAEETQSKRISASVPDKSLACIPQRFQLEMLRRGWILRNVIIWHKSNPMPSSAKDRFTVDFEYLFFFSKEPKYYFKQQLEPHKSLDDLRRRNITLKKGNLDHPRNDLHADSKGNFRDRSEYYNPQGRNKRTVWEISTKGFPEAHFAVYPEELCETPIKAGCPLKVCKNCGSPEKIVRKKKKNSEAFNIRVRDVKEGRIKHSDRRASDDEVENYDESSYEAEEKEIVLWEGCDCDSEFEPGVVLDPFFGAGTTGLVAKKLGRDYVGVDLNPEYIEIAEKRIGGWKNQERLSKYG